jgi:hypothetical protein
MFIVNTMINCRKTTALLLVTKDSGEPELYRTVIGYISMTFKNQLSSI